MKFTNSQEDEESDKKAIDIQIDNNIKLQSFKIKWGIVLIIAITSLVLALY